MWRCEDVEMWKCEDVEMGRWGDGMAGMMNFFGCIT